jgi:hypothetical protein
MLKINDFFSLSTSFITFILHAKLRSPFGSINFLRNQLLKTNEPLNGAVFTLFFRN